MLTNYAAAAADLTEKIAAANRKRTTAARDGDGDPARPADRADAPPHTHPAAAAFLPRRAAQKPAAATFLAE